MMAGFGSALAQAAAHGGKMTPWPKQSHSDNGSQMSCFWAMSKKVLKSAICYSQGGFKHSREHSHWSHMGAMTIQGLSSNSFAPRNSGYNNTCD